MKKQIMVAVLMVAFVLALAGCSVAQSVESGIEPMLSTLKADVETLLKDIGVIEKVAVDVIKEDEKTVRYQITLLAEDAEVKFDELEGQVGEYTDEIAKKLQSLKDKGVSEAKIIVSVVSAKGEELYQKVFE